MTKTMTPRAPASAAGDADGGLESVLDQAVLELPLVAACMQAPGLSELGMPEPRTRTIHGRLRHVLEDDEILHERALTTLAAAARGPTRTGTARRCTHCAGTSRRGSLRTPSY